MITRARLCSLIGFKQYVCFKYFKRDVPQHDCFNNISKKLADVGLSKLPLLGSRFAGADRLLESPITDVFAYENINDGISRATAMRYFAETV